jgi:hypothetical protein
VKGQDTGDAWSDLYSTDISVPASSRFIIAVVAHHEGSKIECEV